MDFENLRRRVERVAYEVGNKGSDCCCHARVKRISFVDDDGRRHTMPVAWLWCCIARGRLMSYTLRLRCRLGDPACVRHDHQEAIMGEQPKSTRQRILTDDDVRLIRKDPRSVPELARHFKVGERTIRRVRRGVSKSGVPDVAPDAAPVAHDAAQAKAAE